MTKRWSSVRSDLVTTKKAASKMAREEGNKLLLQEWSVNMRDPERIRSITTKLHDFWHQNPDLRFFQMMDMIANKINIRHAQSGTDMFYVEDDLLENELYALLNGGYYPS
jgi:hypothetical protein